MSGSSGTGGKWPFSYSRGLMISQVDVGGRSRAPAKAACLALVHPDILLEAEAFAVREHQRLGEQQRSARQNGGVSRARHLLLDDVDDFRIFEQAVAHRLEDVVHHDGRGLALGDGFAGGVELVLGQMGGVVAGVE